MTGSAAEREIRDAVGTRLRQLWPGARVVHELNADGSGSNRIDVAAVGVDRLIGIEIKSEKDVTDRLAGQMHAFGPRCHALIVCAHQKFFESPGMVTGTSRRREKVLKPDGDGRFAVVHEFVSQEYQRSQPSPMQVELARYPHWNVIEWKYPEPDGYGRWGVEPYQWGRPWPWLMLSMLWRDELVAECRLHRIATSPKSTRTDMMSSMLHLMRGPEIERAVCRQLRRRAFAEADTPIIDEVEHA